MELDISRNAVENRERWGVWFDVLNVNFQERRNDVGSERGSFLSAYESKSHDANFFEEIC